MEHFGHRLAEAVLAAGNPCCVGLDPHIGLLPTPVAELKEPIYYRLLNWGKGVIDALEGIVPAVKPQVAFYEMHGKMGWQALEGTVAYARRKGMMVVLDAKRGDIGSTARAYARMGLHKDGPLNADSMTVNPYLGPESLTPFIDVCKNQGKGIWVLVRTSNPGAELWQLNNRPSEVQAPAYRVADWIEAQNVEWTCDHSLGPIGAVIAATLKGREAQDIRARMPNTWFLVPGYGAQGATSENLRGHFREDGLGALVVSARGVLFSPDKKPEGDDWQDKVRDRAAAFAEDMQSVMPRNR